jgi:hypothetical protein
MVVNPGDGDVIDAGDIIYLGGTTGANTARISLLETLILSANMETPFLIQLGTPGETRVVAVATNQTMAQNSTASFNTWQGNPMLASGANILYDNYDLTENGPNSE